MSFLFFKAPGSFLRKEAVTTPHKQICKDQNIIKAHESSDAPLSGVKSKVEIFKQLARKELNKPGECGQKCGIEFIGSDHSSVWKGPPINELVSKLVLQIRLLPEVERESDLKQCHEVDDAENEDLIQNFKVDGESEQSLEVDDAQSGDLNQCIDVDDVENEDSNQSIEFDDAESKVEQSPSCKTWPSNPTEEEVFEASPPAHFQTYCKDGAVELRSVFRGGYERLGLGPRPKLHVTWASDVYDPPCTSSSHTSSKSCRKYHNPKHDKKSHKSKSSSSTHSKRKGGIHGEYKKSEKKLSRKPRQASEVSSLSLTIAAQRIRHGTHNALAWADEDFAWDDSLRSTINNFALSEEHPLFSSTEKDSQTMCLGSANVGESSAT